jgi:hypothetical protein
MRWNENIEIIWEVGDWITFQDIGCSDTWLFKVDSVDSIRFGSSECYTVAKQDTSFGNGQWQWEKYPILKKDCFVFFHKSIHDFTPANFKDIRECRKLEKIMIGNYEVKFGNDIKFTNADEMWDKDIIQVECQIIDKETFLKIGKKAGWITE